MNIETQLNNPLITGTELISLELDGLPPTVNHMYLSVRGRRFRTDECVAYQDYVVKEISRYRAHEWPYSGRCSLILIFTASNKKRWDIDNRVKSIQDCLARAGVIKDDTQIDELHVQRVYGKIAKTHLILRKRE
ncbi:MAG: RusA family crossover junction endodeoxyribonuclease [Synergistaceae bacterium]|nr:RusA family crossover junction endodeoxyribonuclease [Synergistaceae bacterium]